MPMYKFQCSQCKAEQQRLLRKDELETYSDGCRICGSPMVQQMGTPDVRTLETSDEYRGKTKVQGVEKMIEERAKDHDRKHTPQTTEE